jgi:molecular chaperone HscB
LQQQKNTLEAKFGSLLDELHGYWNEWDAAADSGNEAESRKVRAQMVDLLNRRSYIRNLVRDVNEALEN